MRHVAVGRTGFIQLRGRTPNEIRLGRFIRDPDGHGTGNESGQNGDDNGDGSNQNGNNGNNQNNNSQTPDFKSFWNPSAGDDDKSTNRQDNGNNGNPPANPLQAMQERFNTASFGESFMTPAMVEEMGKGNFDPFNKGLEAYGRNVMKETVLTLAPVLKQMAEEITSGARGYTDSILGTRDTDSFLRDNIPAARSPETAPMVQEVFKTAMTHTKGNKDEALKMTKQMLAITAKNFAGDDGNDDSGGGGNRQPKKVNWLEELGFNNMKRD